MGGQFRLDGHPVLPGGRAVARSDAHYRQHRGAAIAVIVIGLFVYDPLPVCLCLFALAFAGLFGFATSR